MIRWEELWKPPNQPTFCGQQSVHSSLVPLGLGDLSSPFSFNVTVSSPQDSQVGGLGLLLSLFAHSVCLAPCTVTGEARVGGSKETPAGVRLPQLCWSGGFCHTCHAMPPFLAFFGMTKACHLPTPKMNR